MSSIQWQFCRRFLKIELLKGATGDAESAISVAIKGRKASIPNPESKTVVSEPCHGTFGSIDLELTSDDIFTKCTDLLIDVRKTGGETFIDDDVILQELAFVNVEKESFADYGKCVISFIVEAFQAEFNGEYTVSAVDPNTGAVIGSATGTLQLEDDGEPMDEVLFISSFSGNYFASIYSYTSDDVNSTVGSIEQIKQTCASHGQAVVMKTSIMRAFQGEISNAFMQSLIYHKTNTSIGSDVSQSYFMVFEGVLPHCIYVDHQSGLIYSFVCSGDTPIAGLVCTREDGEISSIDVDLESCNVESSSTSLCFKVNPSLVGVSAVREIACIGLNRDGNRIFSTKAVVAASKNAPASYCPGLRVNYEILRVRCWAPQHKNATVSPEVEAYYHVKMFQGNVSVITPSLEPNSDLHYMQWYHYYDPSQTFAISVESYGYPLRNFKMFYNQVFEDPQEKDWFDSETWEVLCLPDGNPTFKVSARIEFSPFRDQNTGNYEFQVVAGEVEQAANVQLVHPSKIECNQTCVNDARMGSSAGLTCVINHHFLWNPVINFRDINNLPLNITLRKHSSIQELVNSCEYSTGIGQPVIYDAFSKYVKFSGLTKSVEIFIEIYSFQLWHSGEYVLEVLPTDMNCIHQKGGRNFCLDAVSDISNTCGFFSTDKRLIRLFFFSPENFGSFSDNPFSSCSPNSRALMVPGFHSKEGHEYFYRVCFETRKTADPEKLCMKEGGVWVGQDYDFLSELLGDLHNPSSGQHDYIKLFKALSCNSYFQLPNVLPPDTADFYTLHIKYKTSGGALNILKLNQGEVFAIVTKTGLYPTGILCQYPRSLAHHMYLDPDSASCSHQLIDLNAGKQQTVHASIHGNVPVEIICQAIPDGSYIESIFTVTSDSPFFIYSAPYPEEDDVKSFKCAQVNFTGFNPLIGNKNDTLLWFNFHFSNQPLPLDVDPHLTIADLWCYPGDGFLHQPCYGQAVTLKCCGVGNPFQECIWHRHLGFRDIEPILNGQDRFHWNFVALENPQCNDTSHCSYLTIQNITESDDGYYWCECLNGLETYNMPSSVIRSQTQSIQIKPSQSSLVGDPDFHYSLNCESRPTILVGKTAVKGAPVNVKIKCSVDGNFFTDKIVETMRENGVDFIKFIVANPTKTLICKFWASNTYSHQPITFSSSLLSKRIYGDVSLYHEVESDTPRSKVCCKFCALNVLEKNARVACVDKERSPLDARRTFTYDQSTLNGMSCAHLTAVSFSTIECSCELLSESLATITVYPGGLVVTRGQTTQLFNLETPKEEADTNVSIVIETTSETTETPKSSDQKLKSDSDPENFEKIAEALVAQLQEFAVYNRVLGGAVLDVFHYLILEGNKNLTKFTWHKILMDVFDAVAATEMIYLNLTVVPEPKELQVFWFEMVSVSVSLMEAALKYAPDLEEDEKLMVEILNSWLSMTHRFTFQLQESMHVAFHDPKMSVSALKLSSSRQRRSDEWKLSVLEGTINDVSCSRFGQESVTISSVEGAVFPPETLNSIPSDSTVVIACTSLLRETKPKTVVLNAVTNQLVQRVSNVILASVRDDSFQMTANNSMNSSFNFYFPLLWKRQTRFYKTVITPFCGFYKYSNDVFSSAGCSVSHVEHSRGACVCSNNATTNFIYIHVTQTKTRSMAVEYNQWISKIGMCFASVIVLATFLFLVYLADEDCFNVESLNLRCVRLMVLQAYFLSYIAGVENEDVSDLRCTLFHTIISTLLSSLWGLAMFDLLHMYEQVKVQQQIDFISTSFLKLILFFVPGLVTAVQLLILLLQNNSHNDSYSCFLDIFDYHQGLIGFAAPFLVLSLLQVFTCVTIGVNAKRLLAIAQESIFPPFMRNMLYTSATRCAGTDLFVLISAVSMNVETQWGHVLYGCVCLFYTMLLASLEFFVSQDAREARRLKTNVLYQYSVSMKKKKSRARFNKSVSRSYRVMQEEFPATEANEVGVGSRSDTKDSRSSTPCLNIEDFDQAHSPPAYLRNETSPRPVEVENN